MAVHAEFDIWALAKGIAELDKNGKVIGFYIKDTGKYSEKLVRYANIANQEFRSNRVPKSNMTRSSSFKGAKVEQYSTILGGIPPKPLVRRHYKTISSVHQKPKAQKFVQAMLGLALESEKLIQQLAPEIYEQQKKIFDEKVEEEYKFGNLFTSSISNYNISAPFHRDTGNIVGCVNVIIAKKKNATGGNTTIPDYGATVDSADNSMLVYPAWKNVHGVTPIVPTKKDGIS